MLIEQLRVYFNSLRPYQSVGEKPQTLGARLSRSKAEKALILSLFLADQTPE